MLVAESVMRPCCLYTTMHETLFLVISIQIKSMWTCRRKGSCQLRHFSTCLLYCQSIVPIYGMSGNEPCLVSWSLYCVPLQCYLLVLESVLTLRLKQSSQPGLHHDVGLVGGVIWEMNRKTCECICWLGFSHFAARPVSGINVDLSLTRSSLYYLCP